jgi:hypothetical protein
MKRACLMILASLLTATGAQATTYVRVEKDGTKTYSDRPLPGGHPVELQPAQTYSAPPTTPSPSSNLPGEQRDLIEAANFKYTCALSPQNEQTFQNPESVSLSVSLTPALRVGDQVRFALDGNQVAQEEGQTSVSVSYPDRGTHTAAVRVTDSSGKSLCDVRSTFYVQRTGLNSPTRRPTPTPRPTPR